MIISIASKFEEKEVNVSSWKNPTKDFQKIFFFDKFTGQKIY